MEIFGIIFVLQAFISAFLSMSLADHKGHSTGAWFAAGFFLGIFGLIAAAGLPTKVNSVSPTLLHKKCPDCAETIHMEAFVCKFCGKKFSKEQVVAELVGCLQQNSATFAMQALTALRTIKDSSIKPHLLTFIEKLPVPDQYSLEYKTLYEALQLLTQTAGPSILPELSSIVKKTPGNIKTNMLIETIGSLRDPASLTLLLESMKKSELREAAVTAIVTIGPAALPSLEQLLKDAKRSERNLAESIIAKIKQSSPK